MIESSVAVIGATPGGIAAAVRTAREGVDTVLVTVETHLGGMMAGGLSYTDTLTTKERAPILAEFFSAVREHYASTYGRDSTAYEFCEEGYIFEPHVAESIFESLVEAEESLSVHRGYAPVSAERADERLDELSFISVDGDGDLTVAADVFVEATYEGDVAATAGVPYRVGRESRGEYDEQFAGRLYTDLRGDRYYPRAAVGNDDPSAPADRRGPLHVPADKRQGSLDLVPHPAGLTEIYPESTGAGDDAIQAYNYRLCLSRDPDNRRLPEKPDGYDRTDYLETLEDVGDRGLRGLLRLRYLPNEKADMNAADLPGENHDYPEADRERRAEIADRHRRHALGLLYFLQNDEAVPEDVQSTAREWGLATDEFTDTENFPWQFYVRESRRIEGRYTFTENDARHAPGLDRAPVNRDSIAIAEYPLDSHACHDDRQTGSQPEGFFFASQVTRPSQIPYRALLPQGLDNLLVASTLSTTHVAYGTIRLEPTWMHIGEATGVAAALSVETDRRPAALDDHALQSALVDTGVMISFFNEFDMGSEEPWTAAVQFLGTKGLFAGYDARPTDPLDAETGAAWAAATASLFREDAIDATTVAREMPKEVGENAPMTDAEFVEQLSACLGPLQTADATAARSLLAGYDPAGEPLTRGRACRLICELAVEEWPRSELLAA